MSEEEGLLLRAPGPPPREERARLGQPFRLDEELGECRVARVRLGEIEGDLGEGRDVKMARAAGAVGQRAPAPFDVGIGGDPDGGVSLDALVLPLDLDQVLAQADLIAARGPPHRLMAGGPEQARVEVANVQEPAVGIAGRVAGPASQPVTTQRGVTRAGRGHQDAVAPVREQPLFDHGAKVMRAGVRGGPLPCAAASRAPTSTPAITPSRSPP